METKINGKNHKKDYSKINRHKSELDKQRKNTKHHREISSDYYKKVLALIELEKEDGTDRIIEKYKGNYLFMLNRLLYNPRLMPSERLCYKYKCTGRRLKGKLRNKDVIEIKVDILKNTGRKIKEFRIYINDVLKVTTSTQTEALKKTMKLIGLPRNWDIVSGSKIIY